MICILCPSKTQVINSRFKHGSNIIWRRRRCFDNSHIFTSYEEPLLQNAWVVQYSQSPKDCAPFSRDKLYLSIYKSCQHRPNAIPDATGLTATVLARITASITDGIVTASNIAELTYKTLKRFDAAAATSYRAFHDKS